MDHRRQTPPWSTHLRQNSQPSNPLAGARVRVSSPSPTPTRPPASISPRSPVTDVSDLAASVDFLVLSRVRVRTGSETSVQGERRASGSAATGVVAGAQQPPQRRRLAAVLRRVGVAGERDDGLERRLLLRQRGSHRAHPRRSRRAGFGRWSSLSKGQVFAPFLLINFFWKIQVNLWIWSMWLVCNLVLTLKYQLC